MTIGIVRVTCLAVSVAPVPLVTMTSILRRTSSVASSENRSGRPSAERYSITTFCPSTYPSSASPWRNAPRFAVFDASSRISSTPMRYTVPACRASRASGVERQSTAEPLPVPIQLLDGRENSFQPW
jgi:hypothetical protein